MSEIAVTLEPSIAAIAKSLELPLKSVEAAAQLLNEGNTIPFIARYRKEVTHGLDEVALRAIEDALEAAKALSARKVTVLKTIRELGKLTAELQKSIEACDELRDLEEIYLPFKPKRRTRATQARARGLQPLADLLLRQEHIGRSRQAVLREFISPALEVADENEALAGALDIVAEQWSEDSSVRKWLVDQGLQYGKVTSSVKRGKKADGAKFELYFDHQESARRIPSHRILAMFRGEAEGFLRVGLELDEDRCLRHLKSHFLVNSGFEFARDLAAAVSDCFERLLQPATESSVLQILKETADRQAIEVFGKNLHELLMAPPGGQRTTIGIDPGFRTGCKVAVVGKTGKYLASTAIFPTAPRNDTAGASQVLLELISKYSVELIAIGNGTASRETDAFIGELIRANNLAVTKAIVSESGASIYSASEVAGQEFPDLDITVRGAISIARRLQDPLAELVKSDPKSIGVGQYQHDVNQKQLRKCLDRVVESCVNRVGVELNIASVQLLSKVAGIGPKLAENIVAHRDAHGRFESRSQLIKVPKLGSKAFEQAAGFLRIRDGSEPLDNSAVHPESYALVGKMAQTLNADVQSLVGNPQLTQKMDPNQFVSERCGLPTVLDIVAELGKPGRDPRKEFRAVVFDDAVNSMEDLAPNMVLEGVVTNVTHFGAFVDIGVHQDALCHISQLSDGYVSDPNEVVSVGDILKLKVLEVDIPRKRISVTRKL